MRITLSRKPRTSSLRRMTTSNPAKPTAAKVVIAYSAVAMPVSEPMRRLPGPVRGRLLDRRPCPVRNGTDCTPGSGSRSARTAWLGSSVRADRDGATGPMSAATGGLTVVFTVCSFQGTPASTGCFDSSAGPLGAGRMGFLQVENPSGSTDCGGTVLVGARLTDGETFGHAAGSMAISTGTMPRQIKAGSEQSPKGTTSFTPKAAARFSAARKRPRRSLAACA